MLLVDVGAFEREVDEADDDIVRPDRNLAQHQRHARGGLQQFQGLADALVGLVDLVEEQEARDFQVFELAQDQLQLRDLLLVRLAHHHRGVDRGQRRAHIVNEFDRAGAIDEGVVVAEEIRGRDRELDAHLVVTRFRRSIADRRAGLDRSLSRDRAGARQDRLKQRGLAALEGAHQCDAPGTLGTGAAVSCHVRLPSAELPRSAVCWFRDNIVSGERATGKWNGLSFRGPSTAREPGIRNIA